MFGQALFAELPFATIGQPPYIETGWIKDCKDPCNAPGWSKQDAALTDWNVVGRSASDWQKRDRNNVNTIECGDFRPTNIPRK